MSVKAWPGRGTTSVRRHAIGLVRTGRLMRLPSAPKEGAARRRPERVPSAPLEHWASSGGCWGDVQSTLGCTAHYTRSFMATYNFVSAFARSALLAALLLSHTLASALEFVVERGGSTVHVDRQSIRKTADTVQAVWISSSKKGIRVRASGGYLEKRSIKYLTTFDCVNKQFFVQETVWYDGPLAQGNGHTFSSRVKPQWVGPESKLYQGNLNVDVMHVVCTKR